MRWRAALWWSALLTNAALALLLLAAGAALLFEDPEARSDALIVIALSPAPLLSLAALAVFRRREPRWDPSVFE